LKQSESRPDAEILRNRGSQTARKGFANENQIADKFNNWKVDSEAKEWLNIMGYNLSDIEKGGFISAHWNGTSKTEEKIKQATKATIRCIPLDAVAEEGKCVFSGEKSTKRVIFAKAY
jgi:Prolyl-tRNA synthetase, C-terminal